MKLLISQRDEIYDLIEETEFFSPSQFDLSETKGKGGNYTTEIKFKNTAYFFKLFPDSTYQGAFFVNFSPGEYSFFQATGHMFWHEGLGYIRMWLKHLRRELTAPNKWQNLIEELEQVKLIPTNDQSKFTYQEYNELVRKIEQIKAAVDSIPLLHEQQTAIINQLDHLSELAKELNKFDWKSLFIGTIISVIIQLYVTRDNADRLWNLIRSVFSNFFLP